LTHEMRSALPQRRKGVRAVMRHILSGVLAGGFLVLTGLVAKADGDSSCGSRGNVYDQDNLVSDIPGLALQTDAQLVNPWGIAFNPNGADWVANNGTGVSTLYDGDGNRVPPGVVTIPPPPGGAGQSTPNGIVFNSASAFLVTKDTKSSPSVF